MIYFHLHVKFQGVISTTPTTSLEKCVKVLSMIYSYVKRKKSIKFYFMATVLFYEKFKF